MPDLRRIPGESNRAAARCLDDLSHIYFTIGAGGNPLHPDPNRGLYEINGSSVKRIALAGSAEEMTADGDTIVFSRYENRVNSADLTGWNEVPELTGESDQYEPLQVYRYSDRDGFVECVSCYGGPAPQSGGISGGAMGTPFNSSDDGRTSPSSPMRNSTEEDINARLDVYEWHNGVTRLVTDGESEFSDTGSDARTSGALSDDGRTLVFGEGGVRSRATSSTT